MNLFKLISSDHRLGFPQTHETLTMIPLESENSLGVDYLLFSEAVQKKQVLVEEVDQTGQVPNLLLTNRQEKPVFLMDGEHLLGAKQDRTVNLSLLVPGNSKLNIPVSCVEQGRWGFKSRRFKKDSDMHFNRGRRQRHKSVSEAMYAGSRASDQGEVWDAIEQKQRLMKYRSATSSMKDMFERFDERLEAFVPAFTATPHQTGAVFAIKDRIVGFDVFQNQLTLKNYINQLVRSMALDAIEEKETSEQSPPMYKVREFLSSFESLPEQSYPAIGLGTDVRLHNEELTASGLTYYGQLIHACGFSLHREERFRNTDQRAHWSRRKIR